MAPEELAREARSREPARRLFFALWPDEPMRQALAHATRNAVRASGGRPVPAHNLHVTLAFLGSVPERRLGELGEIGRTAALRPDLASVSAPGSSRSLACDSAGSPQGRLELTFDRLEHWQAAHLLCALPAEPTAQVATLAQGLQDRLAKSGFAPDLKPFRPHVTVVRKVARPGHMEKMRPVVWSFTELALVESRTLPEGPLYSVVESYSLCSD